MGGIDARLLGLVAAEAGVGFALGFVLMAGGAPQRRQQAAPRAAGPAGLALPELLRGLVDRLGGTGEAARDRAARTECLRDLPVLLDVLTLGLLAGLSFDASLELYCEHEEGELPRRMGEAMLTWRMGVAGRAQALHDLAGRLESPAFGRFADVVAQALEFGSPLAEALSDQARLMRDERQSQLEEEIERVPVRILIPMGTLIVPAMLLAIMGPLLAGTVGVL